MRRTPFRRKILIYSSILLIGLIAAMLLVVNYQGEAFARNTIDREIEGGRQRVKDAERQRVEDLWLATNSVASDTRLRPLVAETDGATIKDSLQDFQQQNKKSDLLLIVYNSKGQLLARTDKSDQAPVSEISPLLQSPPEKLSRVVLSIDGKAHHVAVVPAEAAGEIFGYVVAAAQVDVAFAQKLKELTGDEIVIVNDRSSVSTFSDADLPWHTRQEWSQAVKPDTTPGSVKVARGNYEAVSTALGGNIGLQPLAVVMKSHDEAMRPYHGIQLTLVAVGLLIALAGIGGSAILARNVTAPVARLLEGTRQVSSGNFDYRLDVQTHDEIGELAESFNLMMQGLRERADMQKFVSQSTVDMIQSSSSKKISAGEKVTLTVLFSDMRGFTTLTENMTPEDTVKMLNACLSLQADRVKKFHGDIDKYVGDCVVALFNGDDMELNAIRCAVEIHRALDALNDANPAKPVLRVGIGIVTGEVILGSIGSEDRLDYTVIGSNVNLCARLCAMAGPRQTLLAESTYFRVEGLVAAEKLEPLQVKGFSEPVPVYRMAFAKIAG